MGVNISGGALFRGAMKTLVWPLALASSWMSGAGGAHACSCERTSPAAGFDRAQYVFTGKVFEAGSHTWGVAADRVWKGRRILRSRERVMDRDVSTART